MSNETSGFDLTSVTAFGRILFKSREAEGKRKGAEGRPGTIWECPGGWLGDAGTENGLIFPAPSRLYSSRRGNRLPLRTWDDPRPLRPPHCYSFTPGPFRPTSRSRSWALVPDSRPKSHPVLDAPSVVTAEAEAAASLGNRVWSTGAAIRPEKRDDSSSRRKS
jgi:hypothetical protein